MITVSEQQVRTMDDGAWLDTYSWVREQIGEPQSIEKSDIIDRSVGLARESGFSMRGDVLALTRHALAHGLPTHPIVSDPDLVPAQRVAVLNKYPPVKAPS